jgi:transposase
MPSGDNNRKLTDEQKQEIVAVYTTRNPDGTWTGITTLARRFGVAHPTIRYVLRRAGVSMRDAKESHAHGKRCKPIRNVPPDSEKPPFCRCGCEQPVDWDSRRNCWRAYVEDHAHNRKYKDRDWLCEQYETFGKTFREIAAEQGVHIAVIKRYAAQFGIKGRRSNPGPKNSAWKGGTTPERQRVYKSDGWKTTLKAVYLRDNYTCQRCRSAKQHQRGLHAHHIKSWSEHPELRTDLANLVTLCDVCHRWVHSKANVNKEFLS